MSPNRRAALWAVAGGIGFALCSPPTDLYPMVWLGLGALYVATARAPTARRAALNAWLWAAVAPLVGMRFIPGVVDRFTPLGWAGGAAALLLLAAGQALPWALALGLAHWVVGKTSLDRRIAFGAAVTGASVVTLVIAWNPGALVSPWPALVQLADLIGERGLTFLFAVMAALVASPLVDRRTWHAPALGVALFGVVAVYGALRLSAVRAWHAGLPTVKVGVVQAAVPARLRWEPGAQGEILGRLRRLTLESERAGVDLSIWPEAAYPYTLRAKPERMPRGRRAIIAGPIRGPVLFGALMKRLDGDGAYNAATIVQPNGVTEEPQAKMELLWFGETVPFSQYWPWLRHQFFRAGGLVPGDKVVLLESGPARIGVLNCYEDTLAGVGRRVAQQKPNLLVNVTNDAWFGPTAEPELHLRLAALRSVELRRDLVRAVNLGIPAWIDASGTVRERGDAENPSVMVVSPALNDEPPTLYVRLGDWPLLIGLLLLLGDAYRRRLK